MKNRPLLLDLFCGAGGAAMGYWRAGFDVVGIDHRPQPNYPFPFAQLEWDDVDLDGFDVVHASPPCQAYSQRGRCRDVHVDLIAPVRAHLAGRCYVIENVPPAPLHKPVALCGTMFGLGVFRHRHFETPAAIRVPLHASHAGRIGDGQYFTVTGHPGGQACKKSGLRFVDGGTAHEWRASMGIDWMRTSELVESIPPAYTEYLGRQIIKQL